MLCVTLLIASALFIRTPPPSPLQSTIEVLHSSSKMRFVPVPSPIPEPVYSRKQLTIHSRQRNITLEERATTAWQGYRLGDMFKRHKLRNNASGWLYHAEHFNESIAVEYMRRVGDWQTEGDSDYALMRQIVDQRSSDPAIAALLPDAHTLVVHLRTGDVIDKDNRSIADFLRYDNVTALRRKGRWMTRSLPFYADVCREIVEQGIEIDTIWVLTGWHFDKRHERSIAYINEIVRYLESWPWVDTVEIRINENPDEDFLIMVNAKFFVMSGGGFSRMIGGLVLRNGQQVFGYTAKTKGNIVVRP